MQDLYEVTHENIQLGVREGTELVFVERIAGHRSVELLTMVGARFPLAATGMGRVLLAHAPAEIQEAVLEQPSPRMDPVHHHRPGGSASPAERHPARTGRRQRPPAVREHPRRRSAGADRPGGPGPRGARRRRCRRARCRPGARPAGGRAAHRTGNLRRTGATGGRHRPPDGILQTQTLPSGGKPCHDPLSASVRPDRSWAAGHRSARPARPPTRIDRGRGERMHDHRLPRPLHDRPAASWALARPAGRRRRRPVERAGSRRPGHHRRRAARDHRGQPAAADGRARQRPDRLLARAPASWPTTSATSRSPRPGRAICNDLCAPGQRRSSPTASRMGAMLPQSPGVDPATLPPRAARARSRSSAPSR